MQLMLISLPGAPGREAIGASVVVNNAQRPSGVPANDRAQHPHGLNARPLHIVPNLEGSLRQPFSSNGIIITAPPPASSLTLPSSNLYFLSVIPGSNMVQRFEPVISTVSLLLKMNCQQAEAY